MSTAFKDRNISEVVDGHVAEIQRLYLEDQTPWVVGYSGGKDSTATLQLVWVALAALPADERHKSVYVITTDTLVENPVVAAWVNASLDRVNAAAAEAGLPIEAHKLTPAVEDTFWVNLVGRGYPAPSNRFRWCTDRMKIQPANAFVRRVVRSSGEVIMVLGTRKSESATRHNRMNKLEEGRVRDSLIPNTQLANSFIYWPIADWDNDDVWLYLTSFDNPWGHTNKDLLTMYSGATEDNECPLVVDTSTPSCGDSRFGCWTCTVVEKDKSMAAMIQNDDEKEWMLPLLDIRDKLADRTRNDEFRDFRRMNGRVFLKRQGDGVAEDEIVRGPYTQAAREEFLRDILQAQTDVRELGAEKGIDHAARIELITLGELREIRRIWVTEKHEIEDSLPRIYQEATGEPFPDAVYDDALAFGPEAMELLRELSGDRLHFELVRELLDVERQFGSKVRRAGIFEELEKAFQRSGFSDPDEAVARALVRREATDAVDAVIDDVRAGAGVVATREGSK